MNITLGEVFKEAFLQGFKASSEGFNYDYPFKFNEQGIKDHPDFVEPLEKALQEFENKIFLLAVHDTTDIRN